MQKRKRLSTTVSAEGYALLEKLIHSGEANNLAEALDIVLAECLRVENRERIEKATIEYYENLSPEAQAEERELAHLGREPRAA